MAIENTIKQILPSRATDLDEYGSIVKKLVKVLNHVLVNVERNDVVYSGNNVTTTLHYADVKSVFDKIDPMISGFISDTEMNIPAKLTLKNIDNDYEAYVIELPDSKDVTKEDIKKLLKLTPDVTTALNTVGTNSYIMLLEDVTLTGDVDIKGDNVIIDLNGYDITGNLNATGTGARIVDNTLTTKAAGEVTGNVTGNFTIYAGKYSADVTAMLPAGHVVEDGYVRNAAYLLEETADEYKVILESELFDTTKESAMHSVVNAVFNVATNFFAYNTVEVDGQNLVSIGSNKLVDLINIAKGGRTDVINEALTYVYPKAVEHIVNGVLDAVADLETLAASTGPIYTTDLTLKPWDILYTVEGGTSDDAYLSVGYEPDEANKVEKALSFYLGDDELKELAEAAGEIVVINKAEITLGDKITYNGGTSFSLAHAGEFDVEIDFTGDPNYVIVLVTLLANNAADKTPYVDAVNDFIENGTIAEVKTIVDNATIADIIAAFKAANGKDFDAMVDAMGYADANRVADIKALEDRYSLGLELMYKVLVKAGLTGNSTKLSAYAGAEFGTYDAEASKFGVDAKVTLKIFSSAPQIVKVTPTLQGLEDVFYGFKLDETTGLMIVDTTIDGITVDDLKELVQYTTVFADTTNMLVDDAYLVKNDNGDDVILNGAEFTITAENATGKDERTYTLIILGDTNTDAVISSGDAVRIQKHAMNATLDRAMTDNELLAGDTNQTEAANFESGDCVKIMTKWLFEKTGAGSYKSSLKNEVIR